MFDNIMAGFRNLEGIGERHRVPSRASAKKARRDKDVDKDYSSSSADSLACPEDDLPRPPKKKAKLLAKPPFDEEAPEVAEGLLEQPIEPLPVVIAVVGPLAGASPSSSSSSSAQPPLVVVPLAFVPLAGAASSSSGDAGVPGGGGRGGRQSRVEHWGPFQLAAVFSGSKQIGWGATCRRHTNLTDLPSDPACKKQITFGREKLSDSECRKRLKRWLLLGVAIDTEATHTARADHVAMNCRILEEPSEECMDISVRDL